MVGVKSARFVVRKRDGPGRPLRRVGQVVSVRPKGEGYEVEVWAEPPCVYLDHWAVRRFSEDGALGGSASDVVAVLVS